MSMKAIVLNAAGGNENFEEATIDTPKAGDNEVLVKVKATSLNPIDIMFRNGVIPVKGNFPTVLLSDISGIVTEVGSNVTNVEVGDPIFTRNDMNAGGGLGEYVAVKADDVVKIPDGVSFEEASTLGIAALTAYQTVYDYAEVNENDNIFMNGASGGVGHFALQFAKATGATVTATTSSHPELLKDLGADQVINYKEEDATETHPKAFDKLIDFSGNGTDLLGVVKDNGYATTPAKKIDAEVAGERQIESERVGHVLNTEQMTEMAHLIADGDLKVTIDHVYPKTVEGVKEAFEALENGHVAGKIVVK